MHILPGTSYGCRGAAGRGGVLSWMPRTLGPQLLPSCPFLWGMSHQRASITSGSWCPCLALTCAPQPHWGVVLWVESRAGWARWAQAQDSPPPPRAGVLGCGWASCCLLGWASLGTSRAGPQDGWEGVLGKRWHAWAAGTLVALRALYQSCTAQSLSREPAGRGCSASESGAHTACPCGQLHAWFLPGDGPAKAMGPGAGVVLC